MQYQSVITLCVILFSSHSLGLEYNRQRYNPSVSTDFLQHEGGVNGQKNDPSASQYTNTQPLASQTNQNGGKRDYVAQFPSLGPPAKSPTIPTTVNNPNSEKRDYVAAQLPQLPSHTTLKPSTTLTINTRSPQSPNGKRDYVAPQYTTLKPTQGNNQQSTGKVKDLINFYDRQNNGQPTPQKVPSYSSILQGSTSQNNLGSTSTTMFTQQTTPKSPSSPTKPLSFSDILSGSKSPSTPFTTPKPTTRFPVSIPPTRPGLPSSTLNKNQNTPAISSGPATDLELQTLSEELLRKDVNNAAKFVTINYQEKTTSQSKDDKAPGPLLTISPEAWNIPTIQKFVPLLDNYERDTLVNEYITPMERNEENDFMDAIMSTSVIRHLMNFLKVKGIVTPDPRQQRDFLKQLWFNLYSRGKGKIGSSGFEHIFVSELKNGQVSGLHNWIYFSKEEAANRINYLGYLKYTQLSDKGVVMKHHFNQQGVDKPVDTMFIGTSPELEMALYTLCFVTRADNECKLKLGNNDVDIVSHTFRYRSKNLIGSAYPQI